MTWPFSTGKFARPMAWQVPFLQTVLARDRVVLCAPTGAGKTAAALAPFLEGRTRGFVDRCIYALPMRALARSLFEEYAPVLRDAGVEHTTLQMGGAINDPDFRGEVIFTTIDQLLSRYLMAPYGGRPANISAGALVGSHIVLDEFHLYPDDEARLTAIAMLDHLRGVSSQVVMTATLPEAARVELASFLDAAVVTVTTSEMESSGDRESPRRAWAWHDGPLDVPSAITAWCAAGEPARVLVCFNTVSRAQAFFRELRRGRPDIRSLLVHARFLPSDRDRCEMTARAWLGHGGESGPSWIVATQVIEVGMDLSADLLLSEIAPAASLVQRAGRCARWRRRPGDPPPEGSVIVFSDSSATSHRPYDSALVSATWTARATVTAAAGAGFEVAIVEAVHGDVDLEAMRRARRRLPDRCNEIIDSIACDGDASARWRLIRNISSQSTLVRPDPESIALDRFPESVSVAAASLYGLLRDPACVDTSRIPRTEDESAAQCRWIAPDSIEACLSANMLVLSPEFASYDADVGLALGLPGRHTPLVYPIDDKGVRERFSYRKDSYEEHVGRCVRQGHSFLDHTAAGLNRLANALSCSDGSLRSAVLLAIALHDTGKLTVAWQSWAAAWQRQVHGEQVQRCIAHTDFDSGNVEQIARSRSVHEKRPPHAVEGAVFTRRIVRAWVDSTWSDEQMATLVERCVLGSIARHHSARASSAQIQWLDPRADSCIRHALNCAGHNPATSERVQQRISHVDRMLEDDELPSPRHIHGMLETLLYWYVARIVRLADQHSFDPIAPSTVMENQT